MYKTNKKKMTSEKISFFIIINYLWIYGLCVYNKPIVKIHQGEIEGKIQQSRNGRYFSSFLGIPYALPPINNLRFKSPQPAESWTGKLEAHKDANMCPQMNGSRVIGDEDCLYINVYAPFTDFNNFTKNETQKNLTAVMVWIHGGAFVEGSSQSTLYSPGFLLDKNIVLVTFNYRLGILGFLSTGDSVAPGNYGLKDQVLALKWIQNNIQFFGGNRSRVTIFGESAGGSSASLHAFSNNSKGLFHQYITQSGNAFVPWTFQNKTYFASFVKKLGLFFGCITFNSEDLIKCLQTKSIDKLLSTSVTFSTIARFAKLTWTPTNEPESEDAFLTDTPENLIAQNKLREYPFISGNVINEGLMITELLYASNLAYTTIRLGLDEFINYFSNYYLHPKDKNQFRIEVKKKYFSKGIFSSKEEFVVGLTRFATDAFFNYPLLKYIQTLSEKFQSPAYFYSFGYQGRESIIKSLKKNYGDPKVGHTDDLDYLFPKKSVIIKGQDQIISELIVDLWTSFAITGKPTSDLLENPNLWTPYRESKNYLNISGSILDIDMKVSVDDSYFFDRMDFFSRILSNYYFK
ncbi:esterase E4-like [Leptopilina heterotoma]|uniref:esterase E4-like n=1 Tax=Leptopilina heterotoma TaxID=63436 RepID=UPI001CA84AB4|nr:esterase E4-like [Leptopilina heterotoma]